MEYLFYIDEGVIFSEEHWQNYKNIDKVFDMTPIRCSTSKISPMSFFKLNKRLAIIHLLGTLTAVSKNVNVVKAAFFSTDSTQIGSLLVHLMLSDSSCKSFLNCLATQWLCTE